MPIITVARGSKWGGLAVAEKVAQTLGCSCIGREDLIESAGKLNLFNGTLDFRPEEVPGLWNRLSSERETYRAAIQTSLADFAAGGMLVYHGHAGHLLLKGVPAVLRVRIITPMDMRVRSVVESEGVSAGEAEAYIKKVDEEWVRWTKCVYGVDWRDPDLYDLILNLEHIAMDAACSCIVGMVRQPQFEITGEVRADILDFSLRCRVKLALILSPACGGLEVEVTANRGAIVVCVGVSEITMSESYYDQLARILLLIVRDVPGVQEARVEFLRASKGALSP